MRTLVFMVCRHLQNRRWGVSTALLHVRKLLTGLLSAFQQGTSMPSEREALLSTDFQEVELVGPNEESVET